MSLLESLMHYAQSLHLGWLQFVLLELAIWLWSGNAALCDHFCRNNTQSQWMSNCRLNISQGRVFCFCPWKFIFPYIGTSKIFYPSDIPLKVLHSEFLISIVAQSVRRIWRFISILMGMRALFPHLCQHRILTCRCRNGTEYSKSTDQSPFQTFCEIDENKA